MNIIADDGHHINTLTYKCHLGSSGTIRNMRTIKCQKHLNPSRFSNRKEKSKKDLSPQKLIKSSHRNLST